MVNCASCGGSGHWRCTSCNGRGYTSRLTARGDMDMSPCVVCAGRRQVKCQFCGGTGRARLPGGQPRTDPATSRKPRSSGDALVGTWYALDGSWLEFARQGNHYRVAEGGPLGKTGQGTARLEGQTVTLEANNVLLGPYSLNLRLNGDQLTGQLNIMGMPVPIALNRG